MNEEQLYESMNGIDEETLEKSEKSRTTNLWKRALAVAACLAIVLTAALWGVQRNRDVFVYNEAVKNDNIHASHDIDYGGDIYTKEPLTEAELKAILPNRQMQWMDFTKTSAHFNKEGKIRQATLYNSDPESALYMSVNIYNREGYNGVVSSKEYVKSSRCRGVEFQIYEYKEEINDRIIVDLTAGANIQGKWFSFSATLVETELEVCKAYFEELLRCFTYYDWGKPNLQALDLGYVPEYIDEDLTHEQATQDREFGKYIPETVPEGFSFYSCERKKNSNRNVLDIRWRKEYEITFWKVSHYDPEDTYYIIDAANLKPGAVIFRSGKYSTQGDVRVRFGDVLIEVTTIPDYYQQMIMELIKIRDSL